MFKRTNIIDENQFKKPTVKKVKEIKTHLKEKNEIEKIFYCCSIQNKRKTVFRMILNLSNDELDKNSYMLMEKLLNIFVADSSIDKLFYVVFSKLLKIKNTSSIKKLCIDHLKAQLSCDKNYHTFLEFLIRHFKNVIVENKNEILNYITDDDIKQKVLKLQVDNKILRINSTDLFTFIR